MSDHYISKEEVRRQTDELIDSILARPRMYATNKEAITSIIWGVMSIQAGILGEQGAPREAIRRTFPGPATLEDRFPDLSMDEFAEKIRPWVEEYRKIVEKKED